MKKNIQWLGTLGAMISCSAVFYGCSKSNTSSSGGANLPYVTPIVKASAPAGFGGTPGSKANQVSPRNLSLSSSDISARFFTSGPTDVYAILGIIDGIIKGLNSPTAEGACLNQTPVPFSITPFGETVTMYAQCHHADPSQYAGDPAFMQFGIKNNVVYAYNNQSGLTYGASQYPGGSANIVTIDGSTTTDSLEFGPTTPTAGVGAMTSM